MCEENPTGGLDYRMGPSRHPISALSPKLGAEKSPFQITSKDVVTCAIFELPAILAERCKNCTCNHGII